MLIWWTLGVTTSSSGVADSFRTTFSRGLVTVLDFDDTLLILSRIFWELWDFAEEPAAAVGLRDSEDVDEEEEDVKELVDEAGDTTELAEILLAGETSLTSGLLAPLLSLFLGVITEFIDFVVVLLVEDTDDFGISKNSVEFKFNFEISLSSTTSSTSSESSSSMLDFFCEPSCVSRAIVLLFAGCCSPAVELNDSNLFNLSLTEEFDLLVLPLPSPLSVRNALVVGGVPGGVGSGVS